MKRRAKPKPRRAQVLIVDDHPVVREGLAAILGRQSDLEVCASAPTAREALTAARRSRPDVAIVDLALGDRSGLELIRDLRARLPRLRVLVHTMHDEEHFAERALRAGASGYVMKESAPDRVVEAVRRVLAGQVFLSEAVSARVLQRIAGLEKSGSPTAALTDRELEVLRWLGRGLGTREIAGKLGRSVKTVEAHRENIKRKLGLRGSAQLVRYAVEFMRGES